MKVFEKKLSVTKQEDGSFNVSMMVNDRAVVVTVVSESDLRQFIIEAQQELDS